MPLLLIFLLLVGIPVIEIALFIEVGGWLGVWPTIGLVVLTALAGSVLLRLQGLAVLARVQASVDAGRLPLSELFDGLCLLVAGIVLLTPGFFTDAIGLLLFLPGLRTLLRGLATHIALRRGFTVDTGPAAGGGFRTDTGGDGHGPIIDGEWETPSEDRDGVDLPPGEGGPDRWS